jgi:hypothetical protein
MLTTEERAMRDALLQYFDRLVEAGAPVEPSLHEVEQVVF